MKKWFLFVLSMATGLCSWAQDSALDQLNIQDGVVQISSGEDFANFAQAVNDGNTALNAVLTNDIEYEGILVGRSDRRYAGTFDGQYHEIKYNLSTYDSSAGLFRFVGGGTIQNLKLSGTLTTSTNKCATIVGEMFGGWVKNCYSSVNLESAHTGDGALAGIVCRFSASGCHIVNCIYTGTIHGENAYNCSGILGWAGDDCRGEIVNTIFLGEVKTGADQGDNPSYTISRRESLAPCINCYYLNVNVNENEGSKQITPEQIANGELCYMANAYDTENPVWFQTLGQDETPIPFPGHGVVYPVGNLHCDGSPNGALTYNNESGSKRPDHRFVDGVCTLCGLVDPSVCDLVDGYYQIGTFEQFAWFAKKVNLGDTGIKAVLTGDIIVAGSDFEGVGTNASKFDGVFDGQGHTIFMDATASGSSWGLFRYLTGTVQNLRLEGTLNTSYNKVGPLVGESFGGKILNVACNVNVISTQGGDGAISGLIGRGSADGTVIENTIYAGTITGNNYNSAAFIGWSANKSTIKNSYFVGEILVDDSQGNSCTFARNPGAVTCIDCYYVNPFGEIQAGTSQIKKEDVVSGALCYQLNGDQSEITWYQTIDEDMFPVPFNTSGVVMRILNYYCNANEGTDFAEFREMIYNKQKDYCTTVVAQKSLVEEYASAISILEQAADMQALAKAGDSLAELLDRLMACADAYEAYKNKVAETLAYLEENSELSNEKVDALHDYLFDNDGPSSDYAFGTAPYILEERLLSQQEIENETRMIDLLLQEAILFAPTSGTNVTRLVANADFSDGFNHWEGKTGSGIGKAKNSTINAAEIWNDTMDMYQTVTGLQNGVYELQVNGAFRPYPTEDYYNTNYAAMLSLNGICNYFQANIEDMMPVGDAVDGFNCHLTGNNPDYGVEDIEGNVVGYTLHGLESSSIAFQAGRYKNSILCNVTDGTLTIGIQVPGTGKQPDWLGFGNIQLIYYGDIDEAADGLDNVLASQSARAQTLLDFEFSFGEDYAIYPNFAQALKEQLKATIDAVATTTDNAGKLALVETFSDLFQQVYTSKKGYSFAMSQSIQLADLAAQYPELLSEEQIEAISATVDRLSTGYVFGNLTDEDMTTDHLVDFPFYMRQVNGVYQLANAVHFKAFRDIVNSGNGSAEAVMLADIDISDLSDPSMGNTNLYYSGTFDGQGHTLTVNMEATQSSYGLFRYLSGTVKNLHLAGAMKTAHNKVGPLAGEMFKATILNCWCSVDITSTQGGDGAISDLVGRASADGNLIQDCIVSGSIDGNSYASAGFIGWSSSTSTLRNCLSTSLINLDQSQGSPYVIARNPGSVTCDNVYYVHPFGAVNDGAVQLDMQQVANGEACALLGNAWIQQGEICVPFASFASGIQSPVATPVANRQGIYDLMGRKIQKITQPGLYIQNGKTILVK